MMSMDEQRNIQRFSELVLKFREDQVSQEELVQFKKLLRTSEKARKIYIETVIMQSVFQGRKAPFVEDAAFSSVEGWDPQLWSVLAEHEKNAEKVDVDVLPEKPEKILIRKVEKIKNRRTFSKGSLLTFVTTAAAAVLLFIYVNFVPPKQGVRVAVLSDRINARWANDKESMEKGAALIKSADTLNLLEGYVTILFDNNAHITIEGPAEFQILEYDMIKLNYGQLYSIIPPEAYGFQVSTPDSKIIDLGTEFGVKQNFDGDMELHVIKGKVVFVAKHADKKINLDLLAGSARKLSAETGDVKEIDCNNRLFVRQINSQSNLIWRGQTLSLANLVAGGNGFTGGTIESGIDPTTGAVYKEIRQGLDSSGSDTYVAVKERHYIDGVFVPDGQRGANQVTSAGHTFSDFPATNGLFYTDITAYPYVIEIQGKNADETPKKEVESKLTPVSEDSVIMDNPCIFMHTNAGVTFDLNQIRLSNPTIELTAFQAGCVSASMWQRDAEFWVLIDGKCVFHCTAENAQLEKQSIQVPILSNHAFLTLATTEGQDGRSYDWCLFTNPEIVFRPRIQKQQNGVSE